LGLILVEKPKDFKQLLLERVLVVQIKEIIQLRLVIKQEDMLNLVIVLELVHSQPLQDKNLEQLLLDIMQEVQIKELNL